MKGFLVKSIITTVILAVGATLLNSYIPSLKLGPYSYVIPLFFLLITGAAYYLVYAGKKGGQGIFFARVVGGMVLRIILCLFFVAIYLYFNKLNNIYVIVYFMVAYFIYTTFEIYDLVSKLRAEKFDGTNVKNP